MKIETKTNIKLTEDELLEIRDFISQILDKEDIDSESGSHLFKVFLDLGCNGHYANEKCEVILIDE